MSALGRSTFQNVIVKHAMKFKAKCRRLIRIVLTYTFNGNILLGCATMHSTSHCNDDAHNRIGGDFICVIGL